MKITKQLLLTLALSASLWTSAQVGIGTKSPKATLDIVGKPAETAVADGVIVPRLTGDQLKAKDAAYAAAQTGTMVYVTAPVGITSTKTINVTTAGYYFFDGTVWQRVTTGNGNTIYNANDKLTANRTANLDGKTLSFTNTTGTAVVNQFSVDGSTLSVDALNNRVGIGTSTPSHSLHVVGDTWIEGAYRDSGNTPGTNGQVLLSTGTGTTWSNNVSVKPTIIGTTDNFTAGISINSDTYMRRLIVLPPGKWIVNIGQIINNPNLLTSSQGIWIRIILSSSSTAYTLNTGVSFIGNSSVGKRIVPGVAQFDFASGSITVENTSGTNQTLYLRTGSVDKVGSPSSSIQFFNGSENYLYALPIN